MIRRAAIFKQSHKAKTMKWQRLMLWRKHRDRDIFTFFDGQRQRSIDPMPAWFAIAEDKECNAERDMPAASVGDRDAWVRVQAMSRRIFNMKPFSEGGLTEYELSVLLAKFFIFNIALKKKRDAFQTQWALTVGELQGTSITQPDGESSSIPSESSSEEPRESSPPSPPPSET